MNLLVFLNQTVNSSWNGGTCPLTKPENSKYSVPLTIPFASLFPLCNVYVQVICACAGIGRPGHNPKPLCHSSEAIYVLLGCFCFSFSYKVSYYPGTHQDISLADQQTSVFCLSSSPQHCDHNHTPNIH